MQFPLKTLLSAIT